MTMAEYSYFPVNARLHGQDVCPAGNVEPGIFVLGGVRC